ncbi:MAG: hypothetical protein HWD61_00235 [Parachlamydiaceae bacterium]|nr:MAG: hypothetical protein HWD61_00235 [Parachlamydiaceae bacterium]
MYEPRKYLQAKRCVNNKVQQEKDRPSPINAEGWHINDSKLDDDKFLADLIQTFLNVFPIKGEERLKIAEFIQHQVKIKLDENSLLAEQGRYTKAGAMNFVLARARGNYEGTKLVYLMSEEELDRHEKLIEEGQRIFEAFEETYALASEKSKQIVKEVAQEALKTAETKLDKKHLIVSINGITHNINLLNINGMKKSMENFFKIGMWNCDLLHETCRFARFIIL